MMKHTPLIRLNAANRALDTARERCSHWDYEGMPEDKQDCCYAYIEARIERALAYRAWRKHEDGNQ